jgi:hypothetical protein
MSECHNIPFDIQVQNHMLSLFGSWKQTELNLLYCKRPTSLYISISFLEELSRHPVWQVHNDLLARSVMILKTRLHYILNWDHQLIIQYVLLLMNVKTFCLTFQQKAMYQVCYYLAEQTELHAQFWQTWLYHTEGKQTQEIVKLVQSNMTYIWGLPSQEEDPLLVVSIQS